MAYGNGFVKRFYDLAPYGIKNLFASSYGLLQRNKRYGKHFAEELLLLSESQYWNKDRLSEYQNKRLACFIEGIKDKIPYYKNNYAYADLSNGGSEINKYPILSKKLVKQNIKDFYAPILNNVIWGHTSGTTGSAMIFPLSLEAYQKEYAFRSLHYKWGGIDLVNRDKIAMCSGHPVTWYGRNKPPFWTYDLINNHMFFSSYHMSESNMKNYVLKLEQFNPKLIHGYPSSIYLLALAFKKYGKKRMEIKAIYTSSETLLDFQRKKIEEIFQVKVFNWYGTSEMSANIVECEKGELHLKSEHSYIEILSNEGHPCKPGESGRIISTNFNNSAFPLIRYDLGDTVTISENQVSRCGRNGLLIDYIDGRIEDYILTPDGRYVGRLDHLFKDAVNVIEAQIEQQRLEEVILKIVRGSKYSEEDEMLIMKESKIRLGDSIKISFEYVNQIPRSETGKFRFIISKLGRI
jgi:phenylacetate-CoA ligase